MKNFNITLIVVLVVAVLSVVSAPAVAGCCNYTPPPCSFALAPCCYAPVCPDPCSFVRGLGGLITGPSNIINCAVSQTGCVAKGAVDIVTAAPLFITATLSGGVNCLVGCFCPDSCR